MPAHRDTFLDLVKGLMLLSVLNIHTVYWSLANATPNLSRELAYLVDIPIFFFISGYLMRSDGLWPTSLQVLRQFRRLFVQYVCVSLLVALGVFLWVLIKDGRFVEGLGGSLLDIARVELTGELWGYFKGYYGSLWYIRVYFSMMLFLPLLVGFRHFARVKVQTLLFLLLFYSLATYQYDHHYFLLGNWGEIAFYLTLFVLGAIYRTEEHRIEVRDVLWSLGLVTLLCLMIFHFDNNELRLSRYKFPPSYQYLVYSLPLLHCFILAQKGWPRIRDRVAGYLGPVVWIGRHSYTFYLLQGLACSMPYYFVAKLPFTSSLALYLVVYCFNLSVTVLLTQAYLFLARQVKARGSRILAPFGLRLCRAGQRLLPGATIGSEAGTPRNR